MHEFLADPCGDRWKEEKFERKLRERLGPTYESYLDTITQMNVTAELFKQKLKLGPSGKVCKLVSYLPFACIDPIMSREGR